MRGIWIPWSAAIILAGCDFGRNAPLEVKSVDTPGAVALRGEIWADNWFAFYLGENLIIEDSIPITTERSFNAAAISRWGTAA